MNTDSKPDYFDMVKWYCVKTSVTSAYRKQKLIKLQQGMVVRYYQGNVKVAVNDRIWKYYVTSTILGWVLRPITIVY